uniref:Uncharacterized protein n=1 Tax=Arundo donax TaxID=35708 RepID=A0A0A9AB22_ARUDO
MIKFTNIMEVIHGHTTRTRLEASGGPVNVPNTALVTLTMITYSSLTP